MYTAIKSFTTKRGTSIPMGRSLAWLEYILLTKHDRQYFVKDEYYITPESRYARSRRNPVLPATYADDSYNPFILGGGLMDTDPGFTVDPTSAAFDDGFGGGSGGGAGAQGTWDDSFHPHEDFGPPAGSDYQGPAMDSPVSPSDYSIPDSSSGDLSPSPSNDSYDSPSYDSGSDSISSDSSSSDFSSSGDSSS